MKKHIMMLIMALLFAASFVGCSNESAGAATKNSQPAAIPLTQTVTKGTTEYTTVATTEMAKAAAEFPDVTQGIYFPLLENFGNACLEEAGIMDDETVYLSYSNGSEEDLDLFITLCGYCGLYRFGGHRDDGSIVYYLMRPGEDFVAIASLMPDGEHLYIQVPQDCNGVEAPEMQVMMDYYLQDLTLPTGYGPNVMPEFYASIGHPAADVDGLTSNVFSGDQETCWFEMYFDVDYPTLHRYLSDMMLCGFSIKYDNIKFSEGTMVISAVYMLDNGTSQVAVSYDAEDGSVCVYYEPGVNRYLLKNAEYVNYIPQP